MAQQAIRVDQIGWHPPVITVYPPRDHKSLAGLKAQIAAGLPPVRPVVFSGTAGR